VGPNFIALLSHRYGARCLPTRIVADEYKLLCQEIKPNLDDYDMSFVYANQKKRAEKEEQEEMKDESKTEEKKSEDKEEKKEVSVDMDVSNLMEHCYELDENEIPARFKLKHLDKIFQQYNPKDPIFDKVWTKIEQKLGNILRKVADVCFQKKLITPVQHERYFVSG
jgi:hypothetical protein